MTDDELTTETPAMHHLSARFATTRLLTAAQKPNGWPLRRSPSEAVARHGRGLNRDGEAELGAE